MNKLTILTATVVLSVCAKVHAENTDFCSGWYNFAYSIAEHRQNNAPMPDVMQAAMSQRGHPATRQLVIDAYSPINPVMSSESRKRDIIEKFANKAASYCYQQGWGEQ